MKQQIVMVVGPDMCGKTQIAKELSRITLIPCFKATSEHTTFLSSRVEVNDQFLNQLRFADPRVFDLLRQTGHSVIFDRSYPCEAVYSTVLGRETDMKMLEHMDASWASIGAVIVFCHRTSYAGINDDLDPSIEVHKLNELHDAYMEFTRWTKCDVLKLNVDDENLDREVDECMKFIGYDDRATLSMRMQAEERKNHRPQVTCQGGIPPQYVSYVDVFDSVPSFERMPKAGGFK